MPPWQLPVQHWAFDEHAVPSALQAVAWQSWFTPQKPEQQSELFTHGVLEPVWMHGPVRLAHWFGENRPHDSPDGQVPFRGPHAMSPPQPSGS